MQMPKFKSGDVSSFNNTIRITTDDGVLPCICRDNSESRSWSIPQQPVDSNTKMGDTVWREPNKISLNVFVKSADHGQFRRMVDKAQTASSGFTIYCLAGVYKNMFLQSCDRPETSETNSGYFIPLNFTEVIFANTEFTAMPSDLTASADDASTIVRGVQSPNK